jgi:hypothetical protein
MNNDMNITQHILYKMISDKSKIDIVQYIRNTANELFHNGSLNTFSKENITIEYINTCYWLLNTIKSSIDQMNTHMNTHTREYTDRNPIHELAFTTHIEENKYIPFMNDWIEMNLELPFHFVKKIIEEKGYYISVSERGYRDDLYAPWTRVYNLEISCLVS